MDSIYKITTKHKLNESIKVPTSKSYSNRALILAAVCDENVTIRNISTSTDVNNLINSLIKIGLKVSSDATNLAITNSFPKCEESEKELKIETGDGGTTNRFLASLLALGKNKYKLIGTKEYNSRPTDDYIIALKDLGVSVKKGEDFWLEIQGPLTLKDKFEVNCADTTQFATALRLALADRNVDIEETNLNSSKMYLEMTKKMVADLKSGVREFVAPVDFSSLSYPLAAGAVKGQIVIPNCYERDIFQADSIFLDILRDIGVHIQYTKDGLILNSTNKLSPIDQDVSGCPDLAPTLAFLASKIEGESFLRNMEVLRHKESDRTQEIMNLLTLSKTKFEFNESTQALKIIGSTDLKEAFNYDAPKDHRMIMVASLFMLFNKGGEVNNIEHVNKSFPHFFDLMFQAK